MKLLMFCMTCFQLLLSLHIQYNFISLEERPKDAGCFDDSFIAVFYLSATNTIRSFDLIPKQVTQFRDELCAH